MATQQEMIGFSTTNASPRIAPWGGVDALLGNNPFAVAIPGPEFPILLDIACTTVANGKIRTAAREGKTIPIDWAMDSNGNPTTDPKEAMKGLLAPIGGYKGVGISVVVDLICGALNKNGFSNAIERIDNTDKTQQIGHFFIAINIASFIDINEFKATIKDYTVRFKSVRKRDGFDEVFMPGEIEWRLEQERKVKGVPLTLKAVEELNTLARSLDAPELAVKK
jgi:LDH2 family malate/lactate/ureidoglycolate dehydrogenase